MVIKESTVSYSSSPRRTNRVRHYSSRINEAVTISEPELLGDGRLSITIDGQPYTYEESPESDKTIEDIANSVTGMMKYSHGRALDYLKKNAQLVDTRKGVRLGVPEIIDDNGEEVISVTINGKEYHYAEDPYSGKSLDDVLRSMKGMEKYSQGKALAYLKKNTQLVESRHYSSRRMNNRRMGRRYY